VEDVKQFNTGAAAIQLGVVHGNVTIFQCPYAQIASALVCQAAPPGPCPRHETMGETRTTCTKE
jgi:hypothetical protein